jgi:hypothetical protein
LLETDLLHGGLWRKLAAQTFTETFEFGPLFPIYKEFSSIKSALERVLFGVSFSTGSSRSSGFGGIPSVGIGLFVGHNPLTQAQTGAPPDR